MGTGFPHKQSNIRNNTNSLVVSNKGSSPFPSLFFCCRLFVLSAILSVTCLLQLTVLTHIILLVSLKNFGFLTFFRTLFANSVYHLPPTSLTAQIR